MTTTRREFLTASAAALVAPALAAPALAQPAWPNRLVKIIVPFPTGGGTDLLARVIAQHLQARLGQTFIVENRSGGSGTLGTEQVARATPDGYTLAVNSSGPITIFPHLTKVPYDPIRSFAPVALPAVTPLLLVVSPKSPVHSFAELLERARQTRGGLSICNIGVGSPSQLVAEMFARAFQLDMTHVPHRGSGPALNDAMGGHCDLLFDSGTSSLPLVRAGQLRALGITATKRLPDLPDVPTIMENGAPGFEASAWSAMFAPAGTPPEIVDLLNREIRVLMTTPVQQERLAAAGSLALDLSPAQFTEFLERESAAWGELIRVAKISL
jgi:tripartite-type tricarboxylate transporter receptor subunit TctC